MRVSPASGDDAALDSLVLEALHRAVIVTNPNGEVVRWNRAAVDLYGLIESELLGRPISEIMTADAHERVDHLKSIVATRTPWQGDLTVAGSDGRQLQVFVMDRPVVDAQGRVVAVVSVSEDVSQDRLAEARSEDLATRLALALDAGELGTWHWDLSTGETTWDTQLEKLFGLSPGSFDGAFETYVSLLHPDDAPSVLAKVQAAVEQKTSYVVDHRVLWRDGTVHWLQGKGRVVLDAAGDAAGTIGCVVDVTEQVKMTMEREALIEHERVSRQRLEFLGRINDALSDVSTREEVMRRVTQAAVPGLGDWCAIFVLTEPDSPMPEVEVAHVDPAMVRYVAELQQRFPYDPAAVTGVPAVIRSGRAEFHPEIDEQVIADADTSDEAREIVRALALRSAITVPLVKQGRVLGAMQFVNTETSRRYTSDDLALAHATAARIASSLEYIRLNAHQRHIAATLQASLLPSALPNVEGLDVAVKYWAAGEGIEVGGDFYDLFEVRDGWAVVIGDVCGTGPSAAAVTGLARHTMRASAWFGADHHDVLSHVSEAIRRSGQHTFCTALFGTLSRQPAGFAFSVASGGHPLPILIRASGRTQTVGMPGTLLGLTETTESTTVAIDLEAGDTVVLYTDGVTDVRPPHSLTVAVLEMIVRDAAVGAATAAGVAERIGDALSAILPHDERNDDIALLVLRVTSVPRSAENASETRVAQSFRKIT